MQLKGYLSIILHAHLPFIRHPSFHDFMEEDWLFEAITETYLPLLDAFEELHKQGIPFRLTISLSPTLCEMLNDSLLKERYSRHLNRLIELSEKEVITTRNQGLFNDTAQLYFERFRKLKDLYDNSYQQNLINAFDKFQKLGYLEIMTCAATHGYLPLMLHKKAAAAQIIIATQNYHKYFSRMPNGIWLPECAYFPGLENILAEAGIKYFIVDTHGVLNGTPPPLMETYLPVYCNHKKVAAFGRDIGTSRRVWSATEGYPGNADYREFYRDLGYDAPYQYIKPYLHTDGIRRNIGIKYYRITGNVPLNMKEPYDRQKALSKVEYNADNFVSSCQKQLSHLSDKISSIIGEDNQTEITPIIVAPYDAELFGHWWFEGPDFISAVVTKINRQSDFSLITPSDYLKRYPKLQISQPSFSSWGNKGYSEVWLNGKNDWLYRHLHNAEKRMIEIATKYYHSTDNNQNNVLNQMARELLLAQSSDWPFLLTNQHSECYAQNRFKTHIARFNQLYDNLENNKVDELCLEEMHSEDNLFGEIDYKVYAEL
ncbi:MAG: 1,4-alpha-glucan branching protein domain-containing protein [Planctomycetota bacterium]